MRKYPRENELPLLAVENSGDLPPDASGTICLVARMQVKSVIFIWWARVLFYSRPLISMISVVFQCWGAYRLVIISAWSETVSALRGLFTTYTTLC